MHIIFYERVDRQKSFLIQLDVLFQISFDCEMVNILMVNLQVGMVAKANG